MIVEARRWVDVATESVRLPRPTYLERCFVLEYKWLLCMPTTALCVLGVTELVEENCSKEEMDTYTLACRKVELEVPQKAVKGHINTDDTAGRYAFVLWVRVS
jgi:hypothetical protein